jgi:hypothetical protein
MYIYYARAVSKQEQVMIVSIWYSMLKFGCSEKATKFEI